MPLCEADGCLKQGDLRCSACKYAFYCSEKCQKAEWRVHKKSCAMNKILREIQEKAEEEEARKPLKRPPTNRCTGCNHRFQNTDDEDWEEDRDECPDCGYIACESCVSDTSNGSCYCQNSNFGVPYCEMSPRWYHMSSAPRGRVYRGDRHPPVEYEDPDEYENKPRKCGNCSKIAPCLKKEFL
ncbi:hypothetical protein ARMGADRAFT_1011742 [Armillaria gallica]|uniref:MYND-type domain-containing protein n=1 Tax=Armillaria gallica TaxID=47427 RepID=A0A2H3DI18_ARMGA|nr:hypothetical protein ARMGADRAFT_1011742 [Armillaria gallica]